MRTVSAEPTPDAHRAHPRDRSLAVLRWPTAMLLAGLAVVPFLFTAIPPLTDVPGHVGRFAVQTAPAGDPLLKYFNFRWALTLNLASDAVVQALHRFAGVLPITWLLCALTPVLTAAGVIAIARARNPSGASALPWALVFVYNYPFLWGFLNFAFTAGLALIAFASWTMLARMPVRRSILFAAMLPLLLIGHGVAGVVACGLIGAQTIGDNALLRPRHWFDGSLKSLRPLWPLLATGAVTLIAWKMWGAAESGRTVWLPYRKGEALLMMVRDQQVVLDVGTVAGCVMVWIVGWSWGARLSNGAAGAVVFAIALFVATPSLIGGSDRIDTRLAPLIPMLAFALQDWSAVKADRRRIVMLLGFVLLAVRLGVTTASFIDYDRRYRLELTALQHVPPGARILNLTKVDCVSAGWRSDRLEHLSALATLLRGAWVNVHWSIDGLQLLHVHYRPSPDYFRDPSQLIWPASCVDQRQRFDERDRHTLGETVPMLPLGKVDFLWLIGERLPPRYNDPRLRRVWADDMSELYATASRKDRGDRLLGRASR